MAKTIFERTEKKYIITVSQKNELMRLISEKIKPDQYEESNVNSIYYDTDDYRLIRNSIDKPLYKEKLRLRSYSVPNSDSTVFLELKKKYKGVVYKRRKTLKYSDAQNYLKFHIMPDNSQIMRFYDILKKNNIGVTVRREFGSKVKAACGQLRAEHKEV